jgi:hypothetical protein
MATEGRRDEGGDMTEYLIMFNDEWVPDHTDEEIEAKSRALRPLVAEMRAAGVLVFTGGLELDAPAFSVDGTTGTPVFSDGPYAETKELLGGFYIVDVPDLDAALKLAARMPNIAYGSVEVRPVMVFDNQPSPA